MKEWKQSDISDKDVCRAYLCFNTKDKNFNPVFPYPAEILWTWFSGCPKEIIFAAMERAFSRGLINYGVTLGAGWLTERGKEKVAGEGVETVKASQHREIEKDIAEIEAEARRKIQSLQTKAEQEAAAIESLTKALREAGESLKELQRTIEETINAANRGAKIEVRGPLE